MTPEERFWRHVDKGGVAPDSDQCWPWVGHVMANGYGQGYWQGRVTTAHRITWQLTNGPIPEGLQLDHLCRNRRCVRPSHLEPVTQHVNILRGQGASAVNALKTHCAVGHEYTPSNTRRGGRGQRVCRECSRIRDRARYPQRKLEKVKK